ncbi:MAG: YciI family protein [Pseudomonadota bacterium]
MPWYALIAQDREDSLQLRKNARPAHLDRIQALAADGRVLLAGPHPAVDSTDPGPAGFSGSLIVAEFQDLETAQQWFAADPYVIEGVFERFEVKPFLPVLP